MSLSAGRAIAVRPPARGGLRTRLLVIGAALLFAGLVALAAWMSWDARETTWRHTIQSSQNLLSAFEDDITRNVESYDLSLQAVVEGLAEPEIYGISDRLRRLVLFDRAATAQYLGAILVVDATGRIIADSVRPVPVTQNVSDREYFIAHRDHAGLGLFISHSFFSRMDQKWEIGLSRRLDNPDGSFAGVVVGTMQLEFFQQLFNKVDLGPQGSITFIAGDGKIIVRKPYEESAIGRDLGRSELFARFPASRSGWFEIRAIVDAVPRLYVYQQIGNLPLVLGMGVPMSQIFAEWWQKTILLAIATVGLASIAALLGALTFAELRRRSRAEQAATESEQRYRLLADNSTDMIVRAGIDGIRRYVSPASRTLYGYEPEELVGTSAHDFVHPDDRDLLKHAAEEIRSGKNAITTAYRFRHKAGHYVWVEVSRSLVQKGAVGEPEIVLVVRDVTARKEAELALMHSEAQAREQSRALTFMQEISAAANQADDLDTAIAYCVSRLCAHLGWPVGLVHMRSFGAIPARRLWYVADEERFRPFVSTFTGDHWRPARGLTGLALSAGGPVWAEDLAAVPGFRRAKAAQDCGLQTALGVPIVVGGQGFAAMLCFADRKEPRDENAMALAGYVGTQLSRVAERVAAVTRLRESEMRLRAIYDNVLDGIVTLDEQGRIESFNRAAERIFGYSADEVRDRSVGLLLPERYASQLSWQLRTGATEMIGSRREVEGRRSDGSAFPMDLALSAMEMSDQKHFVGVLRDVTQRRAAERMKDEFISTVSHELRTPLTSIAGALILLANGVAGQLPEKARDLVAMARKNSNRLVRLINDILDLERLEAGRLNFDFASVSVVDLLSQAADSTRAFAEQYGVLLSIAPAPENAAVCGDLHRLGQVLTNLIANAVKFSPQGGTTEVSANLQGEAVRFSVRDRGKGIPEEFRPYVFEKYAQADTSDARERGGTGLGLSIAKAIVERHGGRIWFDSDVGRGTVFSFEIPRADPVLGAKAAAPLASIGGE